MRHKANVKMEIYYDTDTAKDIDMVQYEILSEISYGLGFAGIADWDNIKIDEIAPVGQFDNRKE